MNNVIEIKNLSKKYDTFELKDINISIPQGSIVGLVGQNGAGKTTLIKSILEIIKKDTGNINLFNGKKIKNAKEGAYSAVLMDIKNAKEEIGVILDQSFFPEILKVKDINEVMKNIYKNWDEVLFKKYLKEFNLAENKSLKELSTGMHKKLEIACALSHHPKLLILDEPTSGLDPIVRNEILDIFLEFVQDEQNSILLSSHITGDLENIADYIIFINNGEIVFNNDIEQLKNNYALIKCSDKEFKLIDSKDIIKYKHNKYDYEILVSDKSGMKKKYKDLVIDNASIDDIMLLIVKGVK